MNAPALGMHTPATAWKIAVFLAVTYLCSAGWNLSSQLIENPDEPRYACAARDMVMGRGDWMVPKFNGEPRLVKPVLIYWLMAASAKLTMPLGLDMVTAFRLPALLFGLLSVLSMYGLGRRLWNERAGIFAGLMLATTYYFHETAREIVIDPILTGALAWSWYCFAIVLQRLMREPERTPFAAQLGFYVGLGVACMAKGPAPVGVFAAVPMGVYLWWERKAIVPEGKGLGWLVWRSGALWGVPLALVLGLSWFVMLYFTPYRHQVVDFFVQQNFARGVGALDHNEGIKKLPFLYYLGDIPGKFVPWIGLLIPAIFLWKAGASEAPASERSVHARKLLLCGFAIPFLLIGLAGSKRSLYALPLYPFLALCAGMVWDRACSMSDTPQRAAWRAASILLGLLALAAPAAIFVASAKGWGTQSVLLVSGACVAVAAGMAVWSFMKGQVGRAGIQTLLVIGAALLVFEATIRPALDARKGDKVAFYNALNETAGTQRPVVYLGTSANEAVWFLDREVTRLLDAQAELGDTFFGTPGAVLVVRDKEFEAIAGLKPAVRVLREMQYDRSRYYFVEADPASPPKEGVFKRGGARLKTDDGE